MTPLPAEAAGGPGPGTGIPVPRAGWSAGKLAWLAVACTAVQLVVVLRLGRVPRTVQGSLGTPPRSGWVWDAVGANAALSGGFGAHSDAFGDDPRDPFQAVARAAMSRPTYRFAEWTAPPRWLTNPPAWSMVGAVPAPVEPRSPSAVRPPAPVGSTLPLVADRTTVGAEGGLASRAWDKAPEIGPWDGVELLGSTRLEVLVNPQGWVVLARIVESSGLRAADDTARRALSEARFRPLAGAAKRPGFAPDELTAGFVTVRWSTRTSMR